MLATDRIQLSPEVELLVPLPAGTIVKTWDGTIGHISWCSHEECDVVYPSRLAGRGPWRYERWQVEPVTAADHATAMEVRP